MDIKEAGEKWKSLHKEWVFANQEARRMELKNIEHFSQAAAGRTAGPPVTDLELASKLRRVADEKRDIETAFLREVFG